MRATLGRWFMGGTLGEGVAHSNSATPLLRKPDATVSVTVDWHLKSSFLLHWCITKKGGGLCCLFVPLRFPISR